MRLITGEGGQSEATMNIDSAVLFVVDVQNGFCNEFSAPAVRRILRLVRH
jgi:hypothetical protein